MNNLLVDNTIPTQQNDAAFAAWARIYDSQANPLLALEERYLSCLLPRVDGKDILDAGCGTGRWLQKIAQLGSPQSLHGVDSSAEMLAAARSKHVKAASLIMAQLPALPLPSDSTDVALCSFALSYIWDIGIFAQQLARVVREKGDVFIVDMHPDTARELSWVRGFHADFQLAYEERAIKMIVDVMSEKSFRLVGFYEPTFDEPERFIFEKHRRLAVYQQAKGKPPIYILHFKRESSFKGDSDITICNAKCVLGSEELVSDSLSMHNGHIHSILPHRQQQPSKNHVDLADFTLFPGFVNAHDHLEFALFPRLGSPPYRNATDWAHDIHSSSRSTIATHTDVPLEVRLWWGAIRNLLSGVTTVCHHNPPHPIFDDPSFPVRVVKNFDWTHSLAFGPEIANTHHLTQPSTPFIIHACEGIDTSAHNEFARLLDMDLIHDNTVLVHGLAMNLDDIEALNSCGAALISCPSSNQFLFSKHPSARHLMAIQRLSIGSDSPLTALGDLLDEVRFCKQELHLSSNKLFECVTTSAAKILFLNNCEGHIAPGLPADFFAIRSFPCSPSQRLCSISWRDIELVVVGGSVRLASDNMIQRLPSQFRYRLSPLLIDGSVRWIDAPISMLFEAAAKFLGDDGIFLNGRQLTIDRRQHVA